jgi:hypothetical protein
MNLNQILSNISVLFNFLEKIIKYFLGLVEKVSLKIKKVSLLILEENFLEIA